MTPITALVPRYPGSKRLYDFDDRANYDSVIEPFTGSGITSLKLMNRGARSLFWADTDPTMRAIYRVWIDKSLHDLFYSYLEGFRSSFFKERPDASIESDQDEAWSQLKDVFDGADDSDPARLAAASLCLRKLTFGGVVRASSNGRLNVTYCKGQLDELKKWRYKLPIAPPFLNLSISQSWEGSFKELEKSNCERAFCLIDPPYWLPLHEADGHLKKARRQTGTMTPCYLGYKPHDRATLDLCVDAVKIALSSSKIKRIVVTNYFSEDLDGAIASLCEEFKKPLSVKTVGRLDGINRGRVATTQNSEAVWSIGNAAIEQLNLLLQTSAF
jgi:site-specific DNA-adenine methylase